jgi:hypothetical protein
MEKERARVPTQPSKLIQLTRRAAVKRASVQSAKNCQHEYKLEERSDCPRADLTFGLCECIRRTEWQL